MLDYNKTKQDFWKFVTCLCVLSLLPSIVFASTPDTSAIKKKTIFVNSSNDVELDEEALK